MIWIYRQMITVLIPTCVQSTYTKIDIFVIPVFNNSLTKFTGREPGQEAQF